LTFQGDLDRAGTAVRRGEQAALRRTLFGSSTESQCAICGDTYPVRFLRAAHIKKRAACTDEEARDIDHIAFSACVFGCDALFETGYLAVDAGGCVVIASDVFPSSAVGRRLSRVEGRRITTYSSASERYFGWHMENVFMR